MTSIHDPYGTDSPPIAPRGEDVFPLSTETSSYEDAGKSDGPPHLRQAETYFAPVLAQYGNKKQGSHLKPANPLLLAHSPKTKYNIVGQEDTEDIVANPRHEPLRRRQSTETRDENKGHTIEAQIASSGYTFENSKKDLDIMDEIPGLYRLLDLINDGSDKIIIEQNSIKAFISHLRPGSYVSQTKIDFKSLDQEAIAPIGIFGSRYKILQWMQEKGFVSSAVASRIRGDKGISPALLRPGLYLLDVAIPKCYLIFWPEDMTWSAKDITEPGKNRVSFMRYLTKLCDQIICLPSDEDVESIAAQEAKQSIRTRSNKHNRLFSFKVTQSNDQENAIEASEIKEVNKYDVVLDSTDQVQHDMKETSFYVQQTSPLVTKENTLSRLIPGNKRCGILTAFEEPERRELVLETKNQVIFQGRLQSLVSGTDKYGIRIGEKIDERSLELLMELGLAKRFEETLATVKQDQEETNAIVRDESDLRDLLSQAMPQIRRSIGELVFPFVQRNYPYLCLVQPDCTIGLQTASLDVDEPPSDVGQNERWKTGAAHCLCTRVHQSLITSIEIRKFGNSHAFFNALTLEGRLLGLDLAKDPYFSRLKDVWIFLRDTRGLDTLSQAEIEEICRAVTADQDDQPPSIRADDTSSLQSTARSSSQSGFNWTLRNVLGVIRNPVHSYRTSKKRNIQLDDTELMKSLKAPPKGLERLARLIEEASLVKLQEWWNCEIASFAQSFVHWKIGTAREDLRRIQKQNQHRKIIEALNVQLEHDCRASDVWTIETLHEAANRYHISYGLLQIKRARIGFTIQSVDFSRQGNAISPTNVRTIETLPNQIVHHVQFVGPNQLLIVLRVGDTLSVTLERLRYSMETPRSLRIQLERFSSDPCIAFDEDERMLVMLGTQDSHLVYMPYQYFDGYFSALQQQSPTLWPFEGYCNPRISCFIPGRKTLVVVDEKGQVALLSLSTKQFRASQLRLEGIPSHLMVTPDGTCILAGFTTDGGGTVLRAFHINVFGTDTQGTVLSKLHLDIRHQIALCSTDNLRLVAFNPNTSSLLSSILNITSTSSEFSFQSTDKEDEHALDYPPLLGCFLEVWERFPLEATTNHYRKRRQEVPTSLYFCLPSLTPTFLNTFKDLTKVFQRRTNKPGANRISSIIVSTIPSIQYGLETSLFDVGDWLVGLFCLIPLHIATTDSNTFVAFKDGFRSLNFEEELLGAGVEDIANRFA
ncbi:hypothetical protein FRC20_007475 [Serendipita sp. 405]|nr:hypothetical protein FRC20_007475 [Serendipita sp. 405]